MIRDAELGYGSEYTICPTKGKGCRTKRQSKRFMPIEILGIGYFLVVVMAGVLLVMQPARVAQIGESIATKELELKALKLRNEDLKKTVAYVESLDFIEEEARLSLGMVDPGEVRTLEVPSVDQSSIAVVAAYETESRGIFSLLDRIAEIFGVKEATAKGSR